MATGEIIIGALAPIVPAANNAGLAFRAGGSTPAESYSVIAYDASAIEYMDFMGTLAPNYAGGGITLTLPWVAASATSGNVVWEAAFRRLNTAEDVDTSHSYSYQAATGAASATNGAPTYTAISFSNAQMDGLLVNEGFILRIRRNATSGSDTMAGDSELLWGSIRAVEA